MTWVVELGDEFEAEFHRLPEAVRIEILARARSLARFGPQLGRPHVDTLKGSAHPNMKELRFSAADGASHSRLTRGETRFSWSRGTNLALANADSMAN